MKKFNYLFILSFLILSIFISKDISASEAYPFPITIKQSDGSEITILLRGDEKTTSEKSSTAQPV